MKSVFLATSFVLMISSCAYAGCGFSCTKRNDTDTGSTRLPQRTVRTETDDPSPPSLENDAASVERGAPAPPPSIETKIDSPPLFKIGFELQEARHLCPWAVNVPGIQNIPLFELVIRGTGRKLWHVEIDWQDLEFVTVPFSNHEEPLLEECMTTIQKACEALNTVYKESLQESSGFRRGNGYITLGHWRNVFTKEIETISPGHYQVTFSAQTSHIPADSFGSLIFPASMPDKFSPLFQPQVTIQHHLSSTMLLILALCAPEGFDELTMRSSEPLSAGESEGTEAPIWTLRRNATILKDTTFSSTPGKMTSEREGFLFLHLLTCLSITSQETRTDNSQIEEVHKWFFAKGGQVNAKAFLPVLSRRPFSDMWKEVPHEDDETYRTFFEKSVNPSLRASLVERFKRINYGDIYKDEEGNFLDLSRLNETDDNSYFKQLLETGVLSTSMIRNINWPPDAGNRSVEAIFANYFEEVVTSVDTPGERYTFDPSENSIKHEPSTTDALSPPHFLSPKDSMGAYKANATDLPHTFQRAYGQAVLEFRMIEGIGNYARNKMELDGSEDLENFLTNSVSARGSGATLQSHALALFYWLRDLIGEGQ